MPHAACHDAVEVAHAVGVTRELHSEDRHAELFGIVVRIATSERHELIEGESQRGIEGFEGLFDESLFEVVVSCGDGSVRGEDGLLSDVAGGVVEGHAAIFHLLSDRFESGEGVVSFVEVENAGGDPEGAEGFDAADAANELLTDARARVAAIKRVREFAVFLRVSFDVGVEKIEGRASDHDAANFRLDRAVLRVDRHGDAVAVLIFDGFEGDVFDFGRDVMFDLVAVGVDLLTEVSLFIEEADSDEGDAESAAALDVVSREDAESSGVNREGFVNTEFEREISDGTRP